MDFMHIEVDLVTGGGDIGSEAWKLRLQPISSELHIEIGWIEIDSITIRNFWKDF